MNALLPYRVRVEGEGRVRFFPRCSHMQRTARCSCPSVGPYGLTHRAELCSHDSDHPQGVKAEVIAGHEDWVRGVRVPELSGAVGTYCGGLQREQGV